MVLDIRDGDGLPLPPGTTLNIDLGGGWQPKTLGNYPLLELSSDQFLSPTADGYLLKVAFPVEEKTDPILFISGAYTSQSYPERLTGNDQFQTLDRTDGEFSSELTFIIPRDADGSPRATHIRLYYRDGSNALDPTAFVQNPYDKLPLVPIPPEGVLRIHQSARFLDDAAFGGMTLQAVGIANDRENVILFTYPTLSNRGEAEITPQLMSNHKATSFFTQELSRFDSKPEFVTLSVKGESAVVLTPAPETTPFSRPERWNHFKTLLLTRSEYDQLRTLAASHFIPALPSYLGLEWHAEDVEKGLTSYQIELIGFIEDSTGLRLQEHETDRLVRIAG